MLIPLMRQRTCLLPISIVASYSGAFTHPSSTGGVRRHETRPISPFYRRRTSLPSSRNHPALLRLFSSRTKSPNETSEKAKHQKFYHIQGTGTKSSSSITTNTGHVLRTDLPRKTGGSNTAPQPVEHLLSALVGCEQATAMYVARWITPSRIEIEKMEFDLEAWRDERGALHRPNRDRSQGDDGAVATSPPPARIQAVKGVVKVFLQNEAALSMEELRILAHETEARCPVADMMIASGCRMDVTWMDGNHPQICLEPE